MKMTIRLLEMYLKSESFLIRKNAQSFLLAQMILYKIFGCKIT